MAIKNGLGGGCSPLKGRTVESEVRVDPKWQRRSWEIHKRFVELARAKGSLTSEEEVINFLALAICGEAGELANVIKKKWQGDEVDRDHLRDEIADIRIYLEHLAHHLEIDIDQVCDAKLDVVTARLEAKEWAAATRGGDEH
jgi:NTP pyrophosphatase (non-canonical NTP hydrolase)